MNESQKWKFQQKVEGTTNLLNSYTQILCCLLQFLCSCTWLDLIRTDPEFLHIKNKSMSSQNHHKIHAVCFRVSWKVIKMWMWVSGCGEVDRRDSLHLRHSLGECRALWGSPDKVMYGMAMLSLWGSNSRPSRYGMMLYHTKKKKREKLSKKKKSSLCETRTHDYM